MNNEFEKVIVDPNNWSANYTKIAKLTGEKSVSAVREKILRKLSAGKIKLSVSVNDAEKQNE